MSIQTRWGLYLTVRLPIRPNDIYIMSALQSNWDNHGPRKGKLLSLDLCKALTPCHGTIYSMHLKATDLAQSFDGIADPLQCIHCQDPGKGIWLTRNRYSQEDPTWVPSSSHFIYTSSGTLIYQTQEPSRNKKVYFVGIWNTSVLTISSYFLPVTLFPNLYQTWRHFSTISGLSINHSKSAALHRSLHLDTFTQIQKTFPFKWQTKALPYLGIFLTATLDTLYQANYPPLYRRMMANLQRWDNNPP